LDYKEAALKFIERKGEVEGIEKDVIDRIARGARCTKERARGSLKKLVDEGRVTVEKKPHRIIVVRVKKR